MLRRRTLSRAALAIVAGLLWVSPVQATDPTIGAGCTPQGGGSARYDNGNNTWCDGTTWQYPVYVMQSAAASAGSSCSTYPAGAMRYNTTISNIEVCNGTVWQAIGNTSSSCGLPSGLSFTDVTGATLSTLYTSGAATITFSGCSSALSVSVTGGGGPQISTNGGGWTTSGSIYSGQTLQVRQTSSNSGSTQVTATVTVASTSTNWHVTTAALDPCTGTATPPIIGQVCTDGSVYAGVTPDGNVAMYAAPCDAGMTGPAGSCTGTRFTLRWSAGTTVSTGITNQSTGKANTAALHADDGNADTPYSAADYCYNLSGYLGHSDWYLPGLGELNIMYQNQTAIGGFQTSTNYWSSSESNNVNALYESFSTGSESFNNKNFAYYVRCARHN
jgi:Protein of unknown function (DUF1566)